MGFFDKLFESPYEREQRERRELEKIAENSWNNREEIANEKIERQLRTGNEYYFQINVTN